MNYKLKGELWKYDGPSGWCFITLPKELSRKIRRAHSGDEEGWGRLKVKASIQESEWATAIWFDTKHDSYLLPVKTLIRRKEKLAIGESYSVKLEL